MKRTRAVKENTRLKKEYGELLAEVVGLRAKIESMRKANIHIQHKDGVTHAWGQIEQDITMHDKRLAFCSPEDLLSNSLEANGTFYAPNMEENTEGSLIMGAPKTYTVDQQGTITLAPKVTECKVEVTKDHEHKWEKYVSPFAGFGDSIEECSVCHLMRKVDGEGNEKARWPRTEVPP